MANNKVNYDINFNIDMSSLELLKEALNNIKEMSSSVYLKMNPGSTVADLQKVKATAIQVEAAMDAAFNPKLNTLNFREFNSYLDKAGLNIKTIQERFISAGASGKRAFRDLSEQVFTANTQLKETKNFIQNIGKTLFNAAKWSIAYGAINNISNGIKSAWTYAISLDSALNDIRIVTGKSYEEMEKFAKSANKAAKALGASTMDYTKGSLIYYQQGLGQKEVEARTAVSAKTANVTGQSMQEVSEELTAVWNGFQVTASEAEGYVDRLAAVAASSASNLEELSTAMSRVASSANAMGINVDQLTAQIATIESVTRQDAASIGTALKTIYSRMGDLAIGAEDEFGVALGDVSGKMKQMGIDILDQEGNMRSMGTVIEEVAAKWDTWTSAQQQAAAVALAGKRQYNNLIALFENWDMYESNKATSENSLGELQKQQDTYMESTKAHLEQLNTAIEKVKNAFFDNKSVNRLIDAFSVLIDQVGSFVEAVGGGGTILLGVFGTLGKVFANTIGTNVGQALYNVTHLKEKANNLNEEALNNLTEQYGALDRNDEAVQHMLELEKQKLTYADYLNESEVERYNTLIKQTNELVKQKDEWDRINTVVKQSLSGSSTKKNGEINNRLLEGVGVIKDKDNRLITSPSLDSLFNLSDKQQTQLRNNITNTGKIINERGNILSKVRLDNIDNNKSSTYKNKFSKIENIASETLKDGFIKDTEAYKKLEIIYKEYSAIQDDSNEKTKKAKELRDATNIAMNQERSALHDLTKALDNGTVSAAAAQTGLEKVNEEADKMAAEVKWRKMSSSVTEVTSVIMQLVAALSAASNLANTWGDESTTTGEKIKQSIMTVASAILMLVPIVSKVLVTAGISVKAAWWEAALIIAAITLIVGGLTVGFKALEEATKSESEKAQDALDKEKKSLEEMKSLVDETKSAYENLLKSVDSYQSSRDSIDKLRAGTDEWREAISKANEQALNLINTYSILSDPKYSSIDKKTGLITINNEGLEYVKEQQVNEYQKQQANYYKQQARVKEANNNLKQANFVDKISPDKNSAADLWGNIGSGAFTGAGTAALIGAAVAGPLRAVLGGIGGLIGGALLGWAHSDLQDAIAESKIEKNNKLYSQMLEDYNGDENYFTDENSGFESMFKEMTDGLRTTDEELAALKESLIEDIKTTTANTEASRRLQQEYAKNILESESNQEYEKAKDKDAVAAAFAANMGKVEDKYSEKTKNLEKNEEFKNDLASSLGISANQITGIEKDKITYIDNEGEEKTITKAAALAQANTYNAKNTVEENLDKIVEITDKMANNAKTKAFTGLAGGKSSISLSDLTLEELISAEGKAELSKIITDDATAQLYGFDDLKTFNAAVEKSYEISKNQYENASKAAKDLLSAGKEIKSGFTVDGIKKVQAGIENAYNVAGTKGANALADLINSVDTEQGQVIADIAANLDWTDEDAVEKFNQGLEEQGVSIDKNSESYAVFIQQLQNSNNVLTKSINKFDDILSKVQELNNLTKDLKVGSILSDDDYKKLINTYAGAEKFFIRTVEGYQMIKGSAAEIRKGYTQRFSSLANAKYYFSGLKSTAKDMTGMSFDSSVTGDALTEQANNLNKLGLTDVKRILKYAGYDEASYNAAVEAGAGRSTRQTKLIQNVLAAAENIQQDANNGKYDSKDIETSFYTANGLGNYTSWLNVKKDRGFNALSYDQQQKIRTSWLSKYAEDYNTNINVIKAMSRYYAGDDEKTFRQLSYLSTYQDMISGIKDAGKILQGDLLAENYKKQNEYLEKGNEKLKNKIVAEKSILDIQSDINSYAEVYAEYMARKSAGPLTEDEQTLWDQILKDIKESADNSSTIAENFVAASQAIIDAVKSQKELQRDYIDFSEKYLKNNNFKNGFELQDEVSITDQYKNIEARFNNRLIEINAYQKQINELERDGSTESLEKAKSYRAELKTLFEEEMSEVQNLYDTWSSGWEKITKYAENYISDLEAINKLYEHQTKLNQILDKTFSSKSNNLAQLENNRKIIEANFVELQQAFKKYNEATSETIKEDAKNTVIELSNTYLSNIENYYETLKEKASQWINEAFVGFDAANESWNRQSTKDKLYLNESDAQLNINKIQRLYQSAIDSANTLNSKSILQNKLTEELNKLKEQGNKLSQYDIDRANAVYELTLKQIALEESQRNASKMKLVRDSNGNLTYSFVQEQDATSKAQEEFETAQNNLYNIDRAEIKSQIDKYYQYISEAQSKIAEATSEGNMELATELKDYYFGENGLITLLQPQMTKIQDNLLNSATLANVKLNESSEKILDLSKTITETDLKDITDKIDNTIKDFTIAYESFNKLVNGDKNEEIPSALGIIKELNATLKENLDTEYKNNIEKIGKELDTITKLLGSSNDSFVNKLNEAGAGFLQSLKNTLEDKSLAKNIDTITIPDVNTVDIKMVQAQKAAAEGQTGNSSGNTTIDTRKGGGKPSGKFGTTVSMYASGGYTGEWGSDGKLAILHEKELVLNKEDTVNMLKMVTLSRDIVDNLNLNQNKIVASGFDYSKNSDILEQQVTISATFPNVNNSKEIEDALNSLINQASQKANENIR